MRNGSKGRDARTSPHVRALLDAYDRAPDALTADTVAWLGYALVHARDGAPLDTARGRRLVGEARARGSRTVLEADGTLAFALGRRTEAARLLREAARAGSSRAFRTLVLPYAGTSEPDGLPRAPDSLVMIAREVQGWGFTYPDELLQPVFGGIATRADSGNADAVRMRADLTMRGLWDYDAARAARLRAEVQARHAALAANSR